MTGFLSAAALQAGVRAPEQSPWVGVLVIGCLFVPLAVLLVSRMRHPDRRFLRNVFLVAFLLRVGATLLFKAVGLETVVAGDPAFYDDIARAISREWLFGIETGADERYLTLQWSGWGMVYLTSIVYYVFGPSLFSLQLLASWAGATVAVVIYFVADLVFGDRRVSRLAAVLVAGLPALVLWSSQGLKDPFITLALCGAIWAVLRAQNVVSPRVLVVLTVSLLVTWAFRSYVFYILFLAIAASLLFNLLASPRRTGRTFVAVVLVAVVLAAVVGSRAVEQVDIFTNLQDIASRRAWSARAATSGFAAQADVSTPLSALAFLPVGLIHILLAPFPWQMVSFQQLATLPDMIIWWALFPFLVWGVALAVRHWFGRSSVLLLFSALLASAYAVAIGNLGTVYRQRTQFVVFLAIFIAVGFVDFRAMLRQRRRRRRRSSKRARERRPAGVSSGP